MSELAQTVLLGVFTLASCVWVGGYVVLAVVARVASRTLAPSQRVTFFRGLGRSYLLVGTPALLVALGTGAAMTSGQPWDGTRIATALVAAALIVSLGIGVAQARRMTRLRAAALAAPDDTELISRVHRDARLATVVRAAIGVLSLTLIALGSLLAT